MRWSDGRVGQFELRYQRHAILAKPADVHDVGRVLVTKELRHRRGVLLDVGAVRHQHTDRAGLGGINLTPLDGQDEVLQLLQVEAASVKSLHDLRRENISFAVEPPRTLALAGLKRRDEESDAGPVSELVGGDACQLGGLDGGVEDRTHHDCQV